MSTQMIGEVALLGAITLLAFLVYAGLGAIEKRAKRRAAPGKLVSTVLIVLQSSYGVLALLALVGFGGGLILNLFYKYAFADFLLYAGVLLGVLTVIRFVRLAQYINEKNLIAGLIVDIDTGQMTPFSNLKTLPAGRVAVLAQTFASKFFATLPRMHREGPFIDAAQPDVPKLDAPHYDESE